jgi:hypothetical protein
MRFFITAIVVLMAFSVSAFEGVVHGAKIVNGVEQHFDIYIKGSKIAVEGEDGQGKYRIIIDRSKEEIFVCIDNPAFGQKGYYHFTAEQLKREKKFKVISSSELGEERMVNEESCKGYTLLTDQGSVVMYASKTSEVDLTGLSKYMDDPVYELIDAFNVKSAIRRIAVEKENESYVVEMTEEETTVDASWFEVPAGYMEYEIKLNAK